MKKTAGHDYNSFELFSRSINELESSTNAIKEFQALRLILRHPAYSRLVCGHSG